MDINGIQNYDSSFRSELNQNVADVGNQGKTAQLLGKQLEKAEQSYIDIASDPEANKGDLAAAELSFKKVLNSYEGFMRIMNSMYQIMRQAASRLDIR